MSGIKGLRILRNVFDQQPTEALRSFLEKRWGLSPRRAHAGYYYGENGPITGIDYWEALPPVVKEIAEEIQPKYFDQMTAKMTEPGEGWTPHLDCTWCFDNLIAVVSLGQPIIMTLTNQSDPDFENGKTFKLFLDHGSVLMLESHARFYWSRSIVAEKNFTWKNQQYARASHLQLIFRRTLDPFVAINDPVIISERADGAQISADITYKLERKLQ